MAYRSETAIERINPPIYALRRAFRCCHARVNIDTVQAKKVVSRRSAVTIARSRSTSVMGSFSSGHDAKF